MHTALSPAAMEALTAAGWHQDRNDETVTQRLLNEVWQNQDPNEEMLEAFPLVGQVLSTYGGLKIANKGPGRTAARDDFHFVPVGGILPRSTYDELSSITNTKVFPIGAIPNNYSSLILSEDGRVFLLESTGYYLVGNGVNDAINNLIKGVALEVFY